LIENHAFLGGKATTAHVGTLCGLYLRNEETSVRYATGGFARKFAEALGRKSKTQPASYKNGLWFLPYYPYDFLRLCDRLMIENNVNLFLHAGLCGVHTEGDKITSLKVIAYDREVSLKAAAVVDCTGEAMVSKLAHLPVVECDEYQQSSQVFCMEDLEITETANLNLILMREIKKGIDAGMLDAGLFNISVVPGSHNGKTVSLKVGIPRQVNNEMNKITPIELMARDITDTVAAFLKVHVAPFRNARISNVAPEAGVRTGRRHSGKTELTEASVMNCEKTPTGIANGSWPVEIWNLGKNVNMQYFAMNDYYQIPAGCLQSASLSNLYFAGRHISATNIAIASARVIGTCLATGFAAGKMAAGLSDGKPVDETIDLIRKQQVILQE
jgi:hypothetical protein